MYINKWFTDYEWKCHLQDDNKVMNDIEWWIDRLFL